MQSTHALKVALGAGDKSYAVLHASIKRVAGYSYMYRDTLTHSTLPTCTRSGAAKSTPTVNGTAPPPSPL